MTPSKSFNSRPSNIVSSLIAGLTLLTFAMPSIASDAADVLVSKFKTSQYFWEQADVARDLIKRKDLSVLPKLEVFLSSEDRHARGNAALVFAGLGEKRGFEIIVGILQDHSARPEGAGVGMGMWTPQAQIGTDRYYAAHLLGSWGT